MTDNESKAPPESSSPTGNLPPVLTAAEVAGLLQVSYKVVLTLAKNGEIPAFMVAGQWRFLKTDLDSWLLVMSRKDYTGPDLTEGGDNGQV